MEKLVNGNEKDYRDRLKEFFEYSGIGYENPLPKEIGFGGGLIKYVLEKELHLSVRILEAICKAFPELNANWLLTGEGLMIRSVRANSVHGAMNTILINNKGAVVIVDRLVEEMNIETPDHGNLQSLQMVEGYLEKQFLKVLQMPDLPK